MKTREEVLLRQVDEIMDSFNVNRCILAMEAVGWEWFNEPDINEYVFRKHLRKALNETVQRGSYQSGGFKFWIDEGEDTRGSWVRIEGGFYIESAITSWDDGEYYWTDEELEDSPWHKDRYDEYDKSWETNNKRK